MNKLLLNIFIVCQIIIIGVLFTYIMFFQENGNLNSAHLKDHVLKSELIFRTINVKCAGLTEVNGGRVWVCDNGHIEYDASKVKFPTPEPPTSEEE